MTRVVVACALSAVLVLADTAGALAGCKFGTQSLPGSIAPNATDGTRFYTANGEGDITISISAQNGSLRVRLPGCGWTYGESHSCTTYAADKQRVAPLIQNPNPFTVTYYFNCDN